MDCRILRALTLKSNGQLSCDDSAGYMTDLAKASDSVDWTILDAFNTPEYKYVRESFLQGKAPWKQCEICDLFNRGGVANDTLNTRISIQVEPTLHCTLRCPSCHRRTETKKRSKEDWFLAPSILHRLVDSCMENKIFIEQIDYLGWGEPLEHPDIVSIINGVRNRSPNTYQTITTHGNFEYEKVLNGICLDRLVISCDGVEQEAYYAYRKNGHVENVIQFIFDAAKSSNRASFIQWKYILFNHNDSDAEIEKAQTIANAAGIDDLLFIITNSKERSLRFTPETMLDFPLRHKNITISPAPALKKVIRTGKLVSNLEKDSKKHNVKIYLDKISITNFGILEIEGWLIYNEKILAESLEITREASCQVQMIYGIARKDVAEVYPQIHDNHCGFICRTIAPEVNQIELGIAIKVRNEEIKLAAIIEF